MVSELEQSFQQASKDVRNINQTPSQETLLNLYSLYKQSIEGDATGKTPYLKGPVAVAKHGAWTELKGTSKEDAMKSYINLVRELECVDVPAAFDDKHTLAKELLKKPINQEEYDEIKELFYKFVSKSTDEKNHNCKNRIVHLNSRKTQSLLPHKCNNLYKRVLKYWQ